MSQIMKAVVLIAVILAAGGIALVARGQSTPRPGESTQARVWVENRNPNEAIPVIVQNVATPIAAHLDTTSTVQTVAGRQMWQYRTVQLSTGATGGTLDPVGMDGWEAVGLIQSGPMGATILFKRPR